jgi:hypothetical protein
MFDSNRTVVLLLGFLLLVVNLLSIIHPTEARPVVRSIKSTHGTYLSRCRSYYVCSMMNVVIPSRHFLDHNCDEECDRAGPVNLHGRG